MQLKEQEDEQKLRAEIAAIQERLNKSIKIQEQLDKRTRSVTILKDWLKDLGYWNSFILGVSGVILLEIGTVTGFLILSTAGVLMLVGGILFTPFLRPVWDNNYRPPKR